MTRIMSASTYHNERRTSASRRTRVARCHVQLTASTLQVRLLRCHQGTIRSHREQRTLSSSQRAPNAHSTCTTYKPSTTTRTSLQGDALARPARCGRNDPCRSCRCPKAMLAMMARLLLACIRVRTCTLHLECLPRLVQVAATKSENMKSSSYDTPEAGWTDRRVRWGTGGYGWPCQWARGWGPAWALNRSTMALASAVTS
jgi:hypothetical protein